MTHTLVQQLAEFTADTHYDGLPEEVAHECKRMTLDAIGCGVAGVNEPKSRIGIEYARMVGAGDPKATIIGTNEKVSVLGAAFANAELINALDMDAVLPPGHVSPYVMPAAFGTAETRAGSGREMIVAMAVSHEMSNRFGKAVDYQRRVKDGKIDPPKVFGYSNTIFGATAAIGRLRGFSSDTLAHALGIAGCISPVNSQIAWFEHVPISTIKYQLAGMLAQQALTAALMGELGHRGDLKVLDDREYGYARFIGTEKWEPSELTHELGSRWNFPRESIFKPYPHCRIMHGMFDLILEIVHEQRLKPDDIEAMTVYVEGIAERPCWVNRTIERVEDAQFSMAHGIAVAAHDLPLGKAWQDPKIVFGDSVMALMKRVTTQVHPDYAKAISGNAASRPARVEIHARGQHFVAEKSYPKGTPSPDPTSRMTDDELSAKFRHNCDGVLSPAQTESLVDALWNLDTVKDFGAVMRLCAPAASAKPAPQPAHAK